MNGRSILGSLQIPVAALGGLLVLFSVGGVVTIPSPPSESEGFVSGLAIIFLYFLGWIGFLTTSLGLMIPSGDGYGITFDRSQRGLFAVAAVAGLLSAIGPFVAFGLLLSNPSLLVTSWLVLMGLAVIALTVGLVWRGVQAVRTRRIHGNSS